MKDSLNLPMSEKASIFRATGRACSGLTRRETEVMQCLAQGRLYKEIADELNISFSAVHKHQHRIFQKLKVGNRTEAVVEWLRLEGAEARLAPASRPMCHVLKSFLVVLAMATAALGGGSGGELSDAQSNGTQEESSRSRARRRPDWAIPYGKEFWRRRVHSPTASGTPAQNSQVRISADLDLGDVIDRVSHAITNRRSGAPQVVARTYTAAFDHSGVRFSPHRLCLINQTAGQTFGNPIGRNPAARASAASVRAGTQLDSHESEAELAVRTDTVRCGNRILYQSRDERMNWSVFGNTAQALLDEEEGLVEHWETVRAGGELSWILEKRPAGKGSLVIEIATEGLNYAGTSVRGVHLADESGTPRVCIGTVFTVDSTGRRCEVAMTMDGDCLTVEISASILAQAAYPLAIDPLISPEFGMDEPVVVFQSGAHGAPVVASNGTNWLVVWAQQPRTLDYERPTTIAGARVSPEGIVMDPLGIPISKPNLVPALPAVASNGRDYFVVWQSSNFTTDGIHGVRVASDGRIVDPGEISVSSSPSAQSPAVAAGRDGYLVVWEERRSSVDLDLFGTLVSDAGAVLNPGGFPVNTAAGDQRWPSVAGSPDGFLVVWMDSRDFLVSGYDVYASRLNADGAIVDTNGIPLCTASNDQWFPCVAANATNYLVVWQDSRHSPTNATQRDVYGTLVTPAGEISSPQGRVIQAAAGEWSNPSVAGSVDNFLVVWRDSRPDAPGIYASRISCTGSILDSGGIQVVSSDTGLGSPEAAACDDRFLVVWDQAHETVAGFEPAVFGARLNSGTGVEDSPPLAVTVKDSDETAPAIASNGTNWFVVWEDWRNPTGWGDIYGVRIGFDGDALDAEAIPISTLPTSKFSPVVASAGGDYLVVWEGLVNSPLPDYDLYAARVGPDGTVLETNGFAICVAPGIQSEPVATSDGTNYLVVWSDGRPNAGGIYGARVTRGGVVLDPNGSLISAHSANQSGPAVAFNGSQYLAVWDEWQVRYGAANDIYAARITTSGTVVDTNKIPVSRAPYAQLTPAVASDGDGFLVVWDDSRNSPPGAGEVYGTRITSDGVVLDPDGFPISPAASYSVPDVAFDGNSFVVVWQDTHPSATGLLADTRCAWIDGENRILLNNVLVNTDAGSPTITSGTSNTFLVITEGSRNGASRILGNLLSFANTPLICSFSVNGGVANLSWRALPGKSYRVQFARELDVSSWSDLNPVLTATNTTATFYDFSIGQDSQRFYRVFQLP